MSGPIALTRRANSILLIVFFFLIAIYGRSGAASGGSITLDHVDGQVGANEIHAGPVTVYLRLAVDNGTLGVTGISNGFRVYSTDGATWSGLKCDTLNGIFSGFDPDLKFIGYSSADGFGADTIGLLAVGSGPVFPPGYSQVAFAISFTTNAGDIGKTICLDSTWFRPSNSWMWVLADLSEAFPAWDGPHCFEVVDCGSEDADGDGKGDSCDVGDVNFSATPTSGFSPLSVSFADQSVPTSFIDTWLWKFGDGATSSLKNPTHVYNSVGIHSVTLVITRGALVDSLRRLNYIQVGRSDSTGFTVLQSYSTDMLFVKAADLDLDNQPDLAWSSSSPHSQLLVAWGQPGGGIGPPTSLMTRGAYEAPLDINYVNRDSFPDIIYATSSSLEVMLNDRDRTFTRLTKSAEGAVVPAVASGYLNDDAYLDVIISPRTMLFGDGDGTFSTSQTLPFDIMAVDVSDFNNDGRDDFVAVDTPGYAVLMINLGGGVFTPGDSLFTGASNYSITTGNGLADFDKDGNADFATVAWRGGCSGCARSSLVTVGFGNGAGGFLRQDTMPITGCGLTTVISDFNRDGNLDVATTEIGPDTLVIWFGDGAGSFPDSLIPSIPLNWPWALASADFNRDGTPDLVTGSAFTFGALKPITFLFNTLPPSPVINPEMVVTAFTAPTASKQVPAVDVRVINPGAFDISRNSRSVAGSSYGRLDADDNSNLDVRTIDYNVQYGEYGVIIRPNSGSSGNEFTMGIRVDGSQQIMTFLNYVGPAAKVKGVNAGNDLSDSIIFYYTVESTPSMSPANGMKTTSQRPTFDWRKLVDATSSKYHFQLAGYFNLDSLSGPELKYNDSTLTTPQFIPPVPLGKDSIYYWRVRGFKGSVWSSWSRTMAAYIGESCCTGTTSNVNMTGIVDLADLSALVSYLIGGGYVLPCPEEANVNAIGIVDLADLSALVSYLTGGGYVLPNCP